MILTTYQQRMTEDAVDLRPNENSRSSRENPKDDTAVAEEDILAHPSGSLRYYERYQENGRRRESTAHYGRQNTM